MAGKVLHGGTLLSHAASPQWLSEIKEEGAIAPLLMVAFFTLKPLPCGRHCQAWLPAWAGLWPLGSHFRLFLFIVLFYEQNILCAFSTLKLEAYVGGHLEGTLPFLLVQ